MSAAPALDIERAAKIVRDRMVEITRCKVCGCSAPFGQGVFLRERKTGEWFCRDHLPADYRARLHLGEARPPVQGALL